MRYIRSYYVITGMILGGMIHALVLPEIWHHAKKYKVSEQYYDHTHSAYASLSHNPFLNTANIKNYWWTRSQFDADPSITTFTIAEQNGIYVDRGSSSAVVMIPGLGTPVEYMAPFISLFSGYDLYILQNRGHGLAEKWYDVRPVKRLWHLDTSCRLGAQEHLDIIELVSYLRNSGQYDNIVGFGTCFGAFCVAKAEGYCTQRHQQLFDKLIIYSGWKSVSSIIDKYAYDIRLLPNARHPIPDDYAQYNGWYYPCFKWAGRRIANGAFSVNVDDLDLEGYLPHVSIPTLFIHPRFDSLTLMPEFKEMWALSRHHNTARSCAIIFDCALSHPPQRTRYVCRYMPRIHRYAINP